MTTTAARPAARSEPRPAAASSVFGFELVKLLVLWRTRILLAVCWLGPALVVIVVSKQSTLPTDTVFGRWMGQTAWAGSLVVLSFCCSWVLPLMTSLVAGDVFAAEDRLGTWRHLLVTVRSRRRIFATKASASLTVILLMVIGLAASSIVGGLIAVGSHPLVGLDGHSTSPGTAAGTVLLSWAVVLGPTLAFAAVGLLGSVAFGRSPIGLLTPALLALLLQIAQLLPMPAVVRSALPSFAFISWRGLSTDPRQVAPAVLGVIVSLVWAVVATALAYLLFRRRDFTDPAYDGLGRRVLVDAVAPLVVLLAVTVGVVAVSTSASASGIDKRKLDASLSTAFAHLYVKQTTELHRPAVTEQQLRSSANCDKGGSLVADTGPGNDWRCVVTWHIPGATAVGQAIYQLDVTPDGRYVADGDGPQSVNGYFPVHISTGDVANPLWQFDGSVDLLTPTQ